VQLALLVINGRHPPVPPTVLCEQYELADNQRLSKSGFLNRIALVVASPDISRDVISVDFAVNNGEPQKSVLRYHVI
jgi:hypothetical protein